MHIVLMFHIPVLIKKMHMCKYEEKLKKSKAE